MPESPVADLVRLVNGLYDNYFVAVYHHETRGRCSVKYRDAECGEFEIRTGRPFVSGGRDVDVFDCRWDDGERHFVVRDENAAYTLYRLILGHLADRVGFAESS